MDETAAVGSERADARQSGHLRAHRSGALLTLLAALLFGVSAPLSKLLLKDTEPLMLAALLYLGSCLGLCVPALAGRMRAGGRRPASEARLRAADLPLFSAAVLTGAILGPFLLMFGLDRVTAVGGSLLLNLEAPLTILLAVLLFGEHLGARQAVASALILAGAFVVSRSPGEIGGSWIGAAAVAGAALAWAIDTNLAQRLSLRDPVGVIRLKSFIGGLVMLAGALAAGERLPGLATIAGSLLAGAFCYGASAVAYVYALRVLGAARGGAYFATAPFLGALAALPILGERLSLAAAAAMALMAAGVALLLRESHGHEHVHDDLEHDHAHVHDDHHRHEHVPGNVAREPHAHPHRHDRLVHAHPHVPDLHHRHTH
jgi:drug/metabolite transporter (DMT)-like permease